MGETRCTCDHGLHWSRADDVDGRCTRCDCVWPNPPRGMTPNEPTSAIARLRGRITQGQAQPDLRVGYPAVTMTLAEGERLLAEIDQLLERKLQDDVRSWLIDNGHGL